MNLTNFQKKLASPFWKTRFFVFFHLFLLSPTKSGNFRVFLAFSLPSEMVIIIIGDEYWSIFIYTVFGFLHFWPFLAV